LNLRRHADRPLVVGHRGAGALVPDNSLEGLAVAVAAGADLVEFDLCQGLLLGHSARELAESPLSFDDALEFLAPHDVGVYVDLKLVGIEGEVAAAVRRHGLEARTVVSTTSARSLRSLARIAPALPRVIGYPHDRAGVTRLSWPRSVTAPAAAALRAVMPLRAPALLAVARANVLALHQGLVSPAVVRAVHARGGAIFAWPVRDPAEVRRLAAAGVDAIVTGNPEMAFDALATLNRS